ncbi:MAG: hypothetical protein KF816_02190 [Melioribacteraceae bacterium]|nr:hypothetical protein [Melioribacteraceae bacterium]
MRNVLLLGILIGSCLTGCTLLGGVIGIVLPQQETFTKDNFILSDYKKGSQITVNTPDDRSIICELDSVIFIEASDYEVLYLNYLHENLDSNLPLEINKEYKINGAMPYYSFAGFDYGGLRFDSLWTERTIFLDFDEIIYLVDRSNKKYPNTHIRDLYNNHQLPLKSRLVLKFNNQQEIYDSVDIKTITASSFHPLFSGIAIGATLDLMFAIGWFMSE